MAKKILLLAITWIILVIIFFVLYQYREVSPAKEFIAWALNVWKILTVLVVSAMAISGLIIKHDFSIFIIFPGVFIQHRRNRLEI